MENLPDTGEGMAGERILIVEDEPAVARGLRYDLAFYSRTISHFSTRVSPWHSHVRVDTEC